MINPWCTQCSGPHDDVTHDRARHRDYAGKLERDGKMLAATGDVESAAHHGYSPAIQHLILAGASDDEVHALSDRARVAIGDHPELLAGMARVFASRLADPAAIVGHLIGDGVRAHLPAELPVGNGMLAAARAIAPHAHAKAIELRAVEAAAEREAEVRRLDDLAAKQTPNETLIAAMKAFIAKHEDP